MLYSEIAGKELIDIAEGRRMGVVHHADLVIDTQTLEVVAIILPQRRRKFFLFGNDEYVMIPWEGILKIGLDVIIVDMRCSRQYFDPQTPEL
ncbi:MAG: YlmC/YmxH family sporulation protein [Limnochordia bacterium]|nr:YlmC/YmxH family sporulation protein [Limnochordia bacterium]MDD2630641.1 YlmC/YmxH family sporulation protein [Limnochordia bacterium]MDD4517779.1 YlmC/YmxH family sporulation protein [Limnochordia bacterium]